MMAIWHNDNRHTYTHSADDSVNDITEAYLLDRFTFEARATHDFDHITRHTTYRTSAKYIQETKLWGEFGETTNI